MFHVRSSTFINQKMVDQQIDLGFSMMPFEHPSMVTEELSRAAAVLRGAGRSSVGERKVIRPADLRGERFLFLPARQPHAPPDRCAPSSRSASSGSLQIDVYSSADACALAARGALGVSIVGPFTARDYLRDGIAVVPFEPRIRYLFRAMRPRYRKPSRLADAFLDAVKARLRAKGWALGDQPGDLGRVMGHEEFEADQALQQHHQRQGDHDGGGRDSTDGRPPVSWPHCSLSSRILPRAARYRPRLQHCIRPWSS